MVNSYFFLYPPPPPSPILLPTVSPGVMPDCSVESVTASTESEERKEGGLHSHDVGTYAKPEWHISVDLCIPVL